MSLRYALLALLRVGPLSGYDLQKQFSLSVGHVWHAPDSQIYPELRKMETEGLIEGEDQPRGQRGHAARVPRDGCRREGVRRVDAFAAGLSARPRSRAPARRISREHDLGGGSHVLPRAHRGVGVGARAVGAGAATHRRARQPDARAPARGHARRASTSARSPSSGSPTRASSIGRTSRSTGRSAASSWSTASTPAPDPHVSSLPRDSDRRHETEWSRLASRGAYPVSRSRTSQNTYSMRSTPSVRNASCARSRCVIDRSSKHTMSAYDTPARGPARTPASTRMPASWPVLLMKSSPCSSFSCANGSSPVAEATSERSWLRLSHSATCALTPGRHRLRVHERREHLRELASRAEREVRRVVGAALVAEAVEQRRVRQPELLDPRPHRRQSDARRSARSPRARRRSPR